MSVVVSMQEIGPCKKQLTVEVPAPAVEAETERVVREFGRRVRIPGFRRGKVPAEMVRRRFAKDIEREVIDRLLPRYWRQAQAESEIDPLLPPQVDPVTDLEPGAPFTFVATVETRPQIELRNIRDFELPDPSIEPGVVDLDQAIEELRIRFGTWVPVARPAARGDLVAAQVEPIASTAETGGAAKAGDEPVEFEVGDERVWEELSLAVSGLAAGQETTFSRRVAPATAAAAETAAESDGAALDGVEQRFRARVMAVKERELPPLDDDLASRVDSRFASVAELREAVAGSLRQARREQRRELRERALLDQLRERHPVELPRGVVERERESLLADYAESLTRRGVRVEKAGIDWSQAREDMQPLAERRVHARLLLDAIAESEPVVLTDEEFERALAALARAQNASTPALRRALDEKGRLAPLRDQLRRDKTIRHLLGEDAETAPPLSTAPLPPADAADPRKTPAELQQTPAEP